MTPEEELAEAALLLAHVEARPMPEALERKIIAQSQAIASEIRFTTTRSAAVVVDTPVPEVVVHGRSALRTWGGWIAAAACFALAVYSWRREALEREHTARAAAAAAASTIFLVDHHGQTLARVHLAHDAEPGELIVDALPSPSAGEEYRLWLSPDDVTGAVAAGALACAEPCAGRVVAVPSRPLARSARAAWLTRETRGEASGSPAPSRVVAEGRVTP